MSTSAKDAIEVSSAIAGIVVCVFVVLDFFLNRWRYIKRIAAWFGKQAMKLRPDSSAVTLEIPLAPPVVTLPTGTSDGVTKTIATYIMCGQDTAALNPTRIRQTTTASFAPRVPCFGPPSPGQESRNVA